MARGSVLAATLTVTAVLCALLTATEAKKHDYLRMIPVFKQAIVPGGEAITFECDCFTKYTVEARWESEDTAVIVVDARDSSHWLCDDHLLFATTMSYHVHTIHLHGVHEFRYKKVASDERDEVNEVGFQIFEAKDSVLGMLKDLWSFSRLFFGHKTVKQNLEFVEKYMNHTLTKRSPSDNIYIEPTTIRSGDVFFVGFADFAASLIIYGTGGFTSHVAMALWEEDTLYIVESTGSPPEGKVGGVIRSNYSEWLENNKEDYVVYAPLRRDLADQFDGKLAMSRFEELEGHEYGYENFLFGWIDTAHENLPPPMSLEFGAVAMGLAYHFVPDMTGRMILEALNKRIGQEGLDVTQFFDYLTEHDIAIDDVVGVVEQDKWEYPNAGTPRVCSALVMDLLKTGGIFDDLTDKIQATEFTPRDVTQLAIWETRWVAPPACEQEGEGGMRYCQISGDHILDLPGYNTVPVYEFMNEKCGALPPDYKRHPEWC